MKPSFTGTTLPLYQIKDKYVANGFMDAEEVKRPSWLQTSGPDNPSFQDRALQTYIGPMISVTQGLSFDGIGEAFVGPNGTYSVNSVPPDTNMATGTTQAISLMNTAFAVFDKTTGAVTGGPYNTNVLWSALGSSAACDADNDGDGVVKFDQLAQRWIVTQFAVSNGGTTGPFAQCVAISQTSDALGSWTVFQFNPSVRGTGTDFPDYPKLGVWTDSYNLTFDMFNAAGTTYEGGGICGIDRVALLNGNNPTIVCAQLTSSDYALLPADIDGPTYPASGSKSVFLEQSGASGTSTALYMYRAKFNFTSGTVVVDSRITITVSTYSNRTCTTTSKCVPQPTHTGTVQNGTFASESKLDTLAAHEMYRASYRNFGSYESILLSGPVLPSASGGTGSNTAERWYELRGINTAGGTGTPTVYQQSTYSPDTSLYRWMGSIAQDNQGNILMGYSGSSSTVFPSIYVTGRVPTDTLSTMESESQVYAGQNSQVNLTGYAYGYRWGDYSAMMLDPDDCTFWYTAEYLKQAGLFNWSTRVLSMSYPTCSSKAAITSPVPSSTLTSATATFLWMSGTGNPSYTLSIGSTQGASNYCGGSQNYNAGVYSATLSCLPTDGSTFWVRLTTVGGAGGFNDYQYTAVSLSQSTTTSVSSSFNPSTYGQSVSFTATVTATSGTPTGTVQFVVDGTNFGSPVALASGSATSGSTTTLSAGTHTVTASYSPTGSYQASNGTLSGGQVVNKALLTVSANNAGMTYGGIVPTLTYSMTGFVGSDNQGNSTTGQPSLGTTATSLSPVGNYAITIAQGTLAAANYTFQFVNGTLTIGPALLTVTADNKNASEGNGLPTFTATYTGFLNGDNPTVLSGAPAFSTDAPSGPPVGTWTIFVTQGTLAAQNYTFTFVNGTLTVTAAVAQITSPVNNSNLSDTTVTFQWTHETDATAYQMWVGSTPGGQEYGYCGTTGLTCTLSGLPSNGSAVYATLYGYANNNWTVEDSAQYTAATISKAQITSPTNGSTLDGTATTFTWTAETGATDYQVWAGTTPGAYDLGYCGSSTLTCTIAGLPSNGQPVYVTLYGLASGWSVQDTATYNASSPAQITSPTKGSTLAGSSATFTWTAESGATSYQLWIGTSPNSHDIDYAGTSGLTASFSNLPTNGQTLYVTLYGFSGGVWSVQDTATYTAATVALAQITSPPKDTTLDGDTETFTWTAESGATSYQLWIGSAPGLNDEGVGGTSDTTIAMTNLPTDGSQVYVTLYGYNGSTWAVQDTGTYTAAGGSPQRPSTKKKASVVVLQPKH